MDYQISSIIKNGLEFFRDDPKRWTKHALWKTQGGAAIQDVSIVIGGRARGAGSACTVGSLWIGMPLEAVATNGRVATTSATLLNEAMAYVKQAIFEQPSGTSLFYALEVVSIPEWNDKAARTFEDVTAVLARAYELAVLDEEEASWQIPSEVIVTTPCQVDEATEQLIEQFVTTPSSNPDAVLV